MATRCQVFIKKNNSVVNIYHHFDGYYEGVGGDIVKNLGKRGINDTDTTHDIAKFLKSFDDGYMIEGEHSTITHYDIEYLYIIDLNNKEIIGYEVHNLYKVIGDGKEFTIDNLEDEYFTEGFYYSFVKGGNIELYLDRFISLKEIEEEKLNKFIELIEEDIKETARINYNESDISIAIGRIINKLL